MRRSANVLFALLLLMLFPIAGASSYASAIRHVAAGPDDVVTINTALGLSTLLELDGRPKAVIVGDQDAFRVEYAGEALAIKPLMAKARSNLFISTANETFRFRLRVVAQDGADFAVKVTPKRRPAPEPGGKQKTLPMPSYSVSAVNPQMKTVTKDSLTLTAEAARWDGGGAMLIVSFRIFLGPSVFGNRGLMLEASDFHVLQNKRQKNREVTISQLVLDQMTVSVNRPIAGTIIISRRDIDPLDQLSMVFAPPVLGDLSQGLKINLQLPETRARKPSAKKGGHVGDKSTKKGKSG